MDDATAFHVVVGQRVLAVVGLAHVPTHSGFWWKKIEGNRGSYLECCDNAINSEDLIFFIEDDYLFEKNCIDEMIFTYSRLSSILGKEIIMCPSDYPFYYDSTYNTNLYFGKNLT